MKTTRDVWGRLVAAVAAPAVALTLAVPPALASDTASTPAKSGIAASAAARAANVKLAVRAQADPSANPATTQDRGFFRSKKGVIALVLAAGVLSWTAISRSKDAVHSPARN